MSSNEFTEVGRSLKDLNASALAAARSTNGAIMSDDNNNIAGDSPVQNSGGHINKAALCRQVLRQLGTKRFTNIEIAEYIREHYHIEVKPGHVANGKASLKRAKARKVPIRTRLPNGLKNGGGASNLPANWGQVNTDYRPRRETITAASIAVQTAADGVISQADILAARDFSQAVGGDLPRALRALQFYTQLVGQN